MFTLFFVYCIFYQKGIYMSNIRTFKKADKEVIIEIYNQSVRQGFETADIEEVSVESRKEWFATHTPEDYPLYVYELNGEVLGWLSVSPYRPGRQALRHTVEISYYVNTNHRRIGICSEMLTHAIEQCSAMNYKSLIAIILDKNLSSVDLLKRKGFRKWGYMPFVADFDGVECGHVYYGLRI
jgi:phosphinothricin acetyltransferase